METVTLSTKGQLIIPNSIRNALRRKAGKLGLPVEAVM
jgi:bifunctional DNA-binding transcriptional regulator/antitoxin component of YhaV-PrlF toxin-antitoxin module